MSKLETLAKAISVHEGFEKEGSVAQRLHNPGNLISGIGKYYGRKVGDWKNPASGLTFGVYKNNEDGFADLMDYLKETIKGEWRPYRKEASGRGKEPKDLTLAEYFGVYAPKGWENLLHTRHIPNMAYASDVSKIGKIPLNSVMGDFINEPQFKDYHLFAHMDRNYVKKGDRVTAFETLIGTIGKGNTNNYKAHLHFSISAGLTQEELIGYINGWSKEKVQQWYKDPRKVDFDKMFGTKMDVGKLGYDWLQWIGSGYHPGVDVNSPKGGDSDFGMPFKSSCDGHVIYEWRGWTKNRGWGNLIIIEAENG